MDIERIKQILNDNYEPILPKKDLWNTWKSKKYKHTLELYFIMPPLLALYNNNSMSVMQSYSDKLQLYIL